MDGNDNSDGGGGGDGGSEGRSLVKVTQSPLRRRSINSFTTTNLDLCFAQLNFCLCGS